MALQLAKNKRRNSVICEICDGKDLIALPKIFPHCLKVTSEDLSQAVTSLQRFRPAMLFYLQLIAKSIREEDNMVLENIKRKCEEHKISIFALERATGLGNGSVSRWATKSPNLSSIKKVADYFGCTVDELIKE